MKHCNQCDGSSEVTNIPDQILLHQELLIDEIDQVSNIIPDYDGTSILSSNNTNNGMHDIFPINEPQITFMNPICKNFYENTLSSSISNGINILITLAFKQNSRNKEALCNKFEMVYHLKNTKFIMSLPTTKYYEYSSMTSLLSKETSKEFSFTHPSSSPCHIRKYYTKNSYSIVQNIPTPDIFEYDQHVCVSIKQIVALILASGQRIDGNSLSNKKVCSMMMNKEIKLNKTKFLNDFRRELGSTTNVTELNPLILHCSIWSDDFGPNNNKTSKQSMWIKTITISAPEDKQTSPYHTYIIAMGTKSKDHEKVNALFYDELKYLEKVNYFYSSKVGGNIQVILKKIVTVVDRPKRASLNSILGHNGSTTARWRYAAHITQKQQELLVSCEICFKSMMKNIYLVQNSKESVSDEEKCAKCCNWNYKHKCMGSVLPKQYPRKKHKSSPESSKGRNVASNTKIFPIEITSENLKKGTIIINWNNT
mgnify:CR=1 FL=1